MRTCPDEGTWPDDGSCAAEAVAIKTKEAIMQITRNQPVRKVFMSIFELLQNLRFCVSLIDLQDWILIGFSHLSVVKRLLSAFEVEQAYDFTAAQSFRLILNLSIENCEEPIK